jgi:glutamine cyclotransferase
MNTTKALFLSAVMAAALISPPSLATPEYGIRVVAQKPLSRTLFTQGLEFSGKDLLISSGLYKSSRLLRLDFTTGEIVQDHPLDGRLFAEGLTVLNDRIYQLTWRSGLMLIYDLKSFQELDRWAIPREGWGLTNNGRELIYSDGSETLYFVDPVTGQQLRTIEVTSDGGPVRRLNELEWIEGKIWANIWGSEHILIIDPDSGSATGRINLTGLLPRTERQRDTDVLNGIAQDPSTGAIWVTGKRWPWMYQIETFQIEPEKNIQAQPTP